MNRIEHGEEKSRRRRREIINELEGEWWWFNCHTKNREVQLISGLKRK